MHVATIAPTGKRVVHDGDQFGVDDARVSADKLVEYDQLGILVWVSEDLREWVYGVASYDSLPLPAPAGVATLGGSKRDAPIAFAVGRFIRAVKSRPRLVWIVAAVVLAVFILSRVLPGSPAGAWVARYDDGTPGFILRISDDTYSIETAGGGLVERGAVDATGDTLTLTPEWTFTDLVDFWGAGHGEPFQCTFDVRGGRLFLSGGSDVIREWERYE